VLNAFSVDVEDYFQVSAFERVVARSQWPELESRVVGNTHRLLELLAARGISGTFYVLGWIAERFPQLVRDIHSGGHELACHSHWHRLIYEQSPDEFRNDVRRAKQAVEDAAGQSVTAYRAPSFSVTKSSLWALEVLVEEGFTLDSSIFPTHHDRYGIPGTQLGIHRIDTPAGPLWEFPMAIKHFGRFTLPVSGGGYFRLYPFSLTRHCLASLNRAGRPFSFYVHPWEIDPTQPRIRGASRLARFRHYVNLASTERKLERLLASFRFGTMAEVLAQHLEALAPAATQPAAAGLAISG
jgi:polysaccharide deacetylase family protein (PEP-CTERM system associated)